MKTFILSHSYYDEYRPHYFLGPDDISQEDFKNLCDSLLDQAAHKSVILSRNKEHCHRVGWEEIIENLIPLLENCGYQLYKPEEINFFGSIIENYDESLGLSSFASNMIINNNKLVYTNLNKGK